MFSPDYGLHSREVPEAAAATFLDDVGRVCGSAVASSLMQAFGGGTVYFSQVPAEHHRVVKVIGLEAAETLARRVGFGRQWVPCHGSSLITRVRAARREAVAKHLNEGKSRGWIAKQLHCTERTVYRDVAWLWDREMLT